MSKNGTTAEKLTFCSAGEPYGPHFRRCARQSFLCACRFYFTPEIVHSQQIRNRITVGVIDTDFIDGMADFNALEFRNPYFQFAPVVVIVTVVKIQILV